MTDRYDALGVREDKNGKAWFTRLGSAFPTRDGLGYTVLLDAIPAPADGQYKIILTVPKPKDEKPQQQSRGQSRGGYSGGGVDDESIPFSMEWR